MQCTKWCIGTKKWRLQPCIVMLDILLCVLSTASQYLVHLQILLVGSCAGKVIHLKTGWKKIFIEKNGNIYSPDRQVLVLCCVIMCQFSIFHNEAAVLTNQNIFYWVEVRQQKHHRTTGILQYSKTMPWRKEMQQTESSKQRIPTMDVENGETHGAKPFRVMALALMSCFTHCKWKSLLQIEDDG